MIKVSPEQWATLSIMSFIAGCIIMGAIVYFVMKNIYERKRRKPTPFLESVLRRYSDMMYDERYAKITDRELIKMLRDTAFIALWLSTEASLRLTRKVAKEEKKP